MNIIIHTSMPLSALSSSDENLSMVFLGQGVCTFYLVMCITKLPSTNIVPIDMPTNSETKSPFLLPTLGIGVFIHANIIGDQQYHCCVYLHYLIISEVKIQSLRIQSLEPDCLNLNAGSIGSKLLKFLVP